MATALISLFLYLQYGAFNLLARELGLYSVIDVPRDGNVCKFVRASRSIDGPGPVGTRRCPASCRVRSTVVLTASMGRCSFSRSLAGWWYAEGRRSPFWRSGELGMDGLRWRCKQVCMAGPDETLGPASR